ncbi:MAG: hypothetical protein LBN38_02440 [Verrucomicrobiota bacterium]|jgi:uncharacterized Zn finger protein|nr:hypothetical protein [Verrucomicrobiota bacterium]
MIPISLPVWFLLVLLVHLAGIFVLSIYYAVRRFRRLPHRREASFVFRCSSCGHVYFDRRNVPMAECEKCGAMNENIKSF